MAANPVLIRKYENRRLYDTTNSRYVNLEEVAQLLKEGHDVRVIDAATGQDITRLVLTQIIVEDARTPDSVFPLELLRQMIISSGQASQETAVRYMKTMLDIYQDAYRAMSPAVNPFSFFTAAAPAAQQPSPVPPNGSPASETAELRQRVAELEKMVAALTPDTRTPDRAAAKKSRRKSKPRR